MDWIQRMNLVLDYIENNLDGEIEENKIAELSASSKGMFQRIFSSLTDMSLSEYVRKRRLTQAAFDVQNTDEKIIDIALKYGYNSADAFSFAFKNFHGITPSDAKKTDVKIQSFYPLFFEFNLSVKGGNDMQSRIVENAEEKLNIEPMILDLFMEGKLKAKGHLTTSKTPCEIIVGVGVGEPNVKAVGYILLASEVKDKLVFDLCNPSEFTQELINKGFADIFPSKCDKLIIEQSADGLDWNFKVIEIVDENNTANIKVSDIIELSEKMKSRTAGGSSLSKEDKLIATVEENFGLRITESIRID
ncbi:MAG: AraC family transcriptional regulator [Oscillospiraceae bacterium]|nr:AraC family transcriptional regulator [Oscillospiraceae bacterium]